MSPPRRLPAAPEPDRMPDPGGASPAAGCGDVAFGSVTVELGDHVVLHVPLDHDPDDLETAQSYVDQLLAARGLRPAYRFGFCDDACSLLISSAGGL